MFPFSLLFRQAKNPQPSALARRGGSAHSRGWRPPAFGRLWSFCLPSDVRPLVGRTDDSASVCARGGWGSGGGMNLNRQRLWLASDLPRMGRAAETVPLTCRSAVLWGGVAGLAVALDAAGRVQPLAWLPGMALAG